MSSPKVKPITAPDMATLEKACPLLVELAEGMLTHNVPHVYIELKDWQAIAARMVELYQEKEMLRKLPHVFVGCDACKTKIKKEIEIIDSFLAMAKETL